MDAQERERNLGHVDELRAVIGSVASRPPSTIRPPAPSRPPEADQTEAGDGPADRERLTALVADLEAENRRLRQALIAVAEQATGAAGSRR